MGTAGGPETLASLAAALTFLHNYRYWRFVLTARALLGVASRLASPIHWHGGRLTGAVVVNRFTPAMKKYFSANTVYENKVFILR